MPIEIANNDGIIHASNGFLAVTCLRHHDMPGDAPTAFKRRAVRISQSTDGEQHEQIEWLVVRLNGVSIYINGNEVLVTDMDLNP